MVPISIPTPVNLEVLSTYLTSWYFKILYLKSILRQIGPILKTSPDLLENLHSRNFEGVECRCNGDILRYFIVRTPPPWKILKRLWKYGSTAVLLKMGCCHFSYLIFSSFIIFTCRNYFTPCKIVLCIWRKRFFFCQHNFIKKVIRSCLRMNLKISHKLR